MTVDTAAVIRTKRDGGGAAHWDLGHAGTAGISKTQIRQRLCDLGAATFAAAPAGRKINVSRGVPGTPESLPLSVLTDIVSASRGGTMGDIDAMALRRAVWRLGAVRPARPLIIDRISM